MSFLNRFLPGRPRDDALRSAVRNLEYLLNSRGGFGSLLCPLGLSDYLGEPSGRKAAQTLLREIHNNILLYEPRLRVDSLVILGRDPAMRWVIELRCRLAQSYFGAACRMLLYFSPVTGEVQIEVTHGP